MATLDELQGIARALNQVKTAGQARQAIGATLRAVSGAYELAKKLPDAAEQRTTRELTSKRTALEGWYREIQGMSAAAPYVEGWARNRDKISAAYVVIAGIEGELSYKPVTSNLDILLDSIKEAPAVFGEAVGTVAKEAGKAAGNVAGGVFSGLGFSGTIGLALVLVVVVVVLTKGTVLGKVLSLVRGGA